MRWQSVDDKKQTTASLQTFGISFAKWVLSFLTSGQQLHLLFCACNTLCHLTGGIRWELASALFHLPT